MSAQDTIATPATLARELVNREVDHERIAAACGVWRGFSHDIRTAAILATIRFYALSRDAWAREALDARARVDELNEALRGAVVTRDAWRDLAVAGAAGLARVSVALGIGPASEHPADAARVAAACVAAAEALTDRPAADPERAAKPLACGEDHAEPCDALDALADVANALDALGESGRASCDTADQIARACLAKIAADHETAERFYASAEATRRRLDAADKAQARAIIELTAERAQAERRARALAAIGEALHLAPGQVSREPADGPTVEGYILDALRVRDATHAATVADLHATRGRHAEAAEAHATTIADLHASRAAWGTRALAVESALFDVAEALGAHQRLDARPVGDVAAACIGAIEERARVAGIVERSCVLAKELAEMRKREIEELTARLGEHNATADAAARRRAAASEGER